MDWNSRWLDIAIVIIVGLVLFSVMVLVHETTHKEIFREYGCNATIHYNIVSAYTEGDCQEYSPEMNLAHAITEAVGYQILIPSVVIFMCLFIIVLRLR